MKLKGKRIAVFIEREFEDLEYWVPVMRMQEEGAEVVTVGTGSANVYHGKHGLTAKPDVTAEEIDVEQIGLALGPPHDVGIPHLLRQGLAHGRHLLQCALHRLYLIV